MKHFEPVLWQIFGTALALTLVAAILFFSK